MFSLACWFVLAHAQVAASLSADQLEADVRWLSGADPLDGQPLVSRHVDHPDHARAGDALLEALQAIDGLEVREQRFDAAGRTGLRNLVADLPGTDPTAGWLVVGAHWDSIGGDPDDGWDGTTRPAPGADDDASGVAAVLGIARAMAGRTWEHPVRFALFDAEEQGLHGSAALADRMVADGEAVTLMWSLDPVGYNHDGGNLLWVTADERWPETADQAVGLAADVAPQLTVLPIVGGSGRSDHVRFWDRDFPAVHYASFPLPETYHTEDDTFDNVDPDYLAATAGLTAAQVALLAVEVPEDEEARACGCASGAGPAGALASFFALLLVLGRRRSAVVLAGTLAATQAHAQATPIAPFTGTYQESWESAVTGSFPTCQDFSTLGTLCATTHVNVSQTFPWVCSQTAQDGLWLADHVGRATFDFATGIDEFGGYFSTHAGDGHLLILRFYNAGGGLVATATEPLGCTWTWRGYRLAQPVTRIEMYSDVDADGSHVLTDNLQVNGTAPDSDNDGEPDSSDNCPNTPNADQTDTDGDGYGDACDVCPGSDDDIDSDNDGLADGCDPCPNGPDNGDADGDGVLACDDCDDTDPALNTDDADGDGLSTCDGDCGDADPAVYPGATEIPDGIDQDCDGTVDETTIWYDDDGDGYAESGGDCDDGDPTVFPGAREVCDGVDQDCDGTTDEGTECFDDDGDGSTEQAGDCSDGDATVHPAATEIPGNGIDDDCDGVVDAGLTDADGDGWTNGVDCDDTDPATFPGAPERCDGADNDCDGTDDEGTECFDDDGDGVTEEDGDCNDADPGIRPGATETQNGQDDDCDGAVDEGTGVTDDDGDGFAEIGGDCDDADPNVRPGAVEVENGVDDDCDGEIDEGFVDLDEDGVSALEGDCEDDNGWVYPGAVELCDGLDNDCDGDLDEGCRDVQQVVARKSGCACSSGDRSSAAGVVGLLVLLGWRRRR